MKKLLYALACTVVFSMNAITANGQSFPSKPVRMLVGFPPGSGADVVARVVATEMSKSLGQSVVVENRVGANSTIAAKTVVAAEPNGYTLNFGSAVNIHPVLIRTNAVDASKELSPVSNSAFFAYAFYVSAKVGATSMQELISISKSGPPGKLNFASTAAVIDLLMGLIANQTGITYTAIPYAGTAQSLPALITGEASMNISTSGTALLSQVHAGTIRQLFYAGPNRSPLMPTTPTAREVGLPQLEGSITNLGIWAPIGVPQNLVQKLSAAAAAAVKVREVNEQLRKAAYEPVGSSPDAQLRAFETELTFWTEAAKLMRYEPK